MPPVTGIDLLLRVGNERQTLTRNPAGGGADTFLVSFRGQTTGAIAETADAATVQTALEGLTTIGAGNVTVAGAAGGPWTVTFVGTLAGQDVPLLVVSGETGSLNVDVADIGPVFATVGGQRGARLRRSLSTADAKAKDTGGAEVSQPLFKGYRIEAEHLLIEDDAAYLALEAVYEARGFAHVRVLMPNAETYTGKAVVSQLDLEGPHDDMATVSAVLTVSEGLTKV